MPEEEAFGSPSERTFVSLLAIATGLLLIYLAISGPLFLGLIRFSAFFNSI